VSSFAKDRHKRVARMVGYCLTLNDDHPSTWHDCAAILNQRFTQAELMGLAFAAMRALAPDNRGPGFDLAHWGVA